jgi:hypothetical protein
MNNSMLAVFCLALGSFQLAIACNTCQQCLPTLADIMQEIDSEAFDRNVLPSQIQIVNSKDFATIKVSGRVPGWNKRAKSVFFEKYKKCQKAVEAANLKLPSTHACRKECRNIRFEPVEQVYDKSLKRYIDLFKYQSNKKRFIVRRVLSKIRKQLQRRLQPGSPARRIVKRVLSKIRKQLQRRSQRGSPARRQSRRAARQQKRAARRAARQQKRAARQQKRAARRLARRQRRGNRRWRRRRL